MRPKLPQKLNPPHADLSRRGFTLIELLVVISVVAILMTITFGVSRGVQSVQARALAKAELSVLAQAIEQFKVRYGDYPRHDSDDGDYPTPDGGEMTNTMLLYALTGRMEMKRVVDGDGFKVDVSKVDDAQDDDDVIAKPQFIEVSKFSTSGTPNESTQLLDPWGNPYMYWYKWENSSDDWEIFGYHLYSTGPNGSEANDSIKSKINGRTGIMDSDFRDVANAAGIIFVGE